MITDQKKQAILRDVKAEIPRGVLCRKYDVSYEEIENLVEAESL